LVMGHGSWVMGHGLWVMGYRLWVMGHGSWVMGSNPDGDRKNNLIIDSSGELIKPLYYQRANSMTLT